MFHFHCWKCYRSHQHPSWRCYLCNFVLKENVLKLPTHTHFLYVHIFCEIGYTRVNLFMPFKRDWLQSETIRRSIIIFLNQTKKMRVTKPVTEKRKNDLLWKGFHKMTSIIVAVFTNILGMYVQVGFPLGA